ncbi:MAG: ATP-dependent 6-phosphofructokinase [Dehalococcoidales bacterium]|nr:ATP-dependent 6-phosphofructokinase [Dehalococcoidales bacterium]
MKKVRIGVLTGGGDCAGLNPALKWVVKTAMDERLEWERGVKYEVVGICDGWKGLVSVDLSSPDTQGSTVNLNPAIVRTWDRYGGTFLGTSRQSPFDPENDQTDLVIKNIERLGLEAIIVIGGDGTLASAKQLSEAGINIVGIPKTIDKDLPETDYTLGFESALNVIVEEVDRLRTTAGSHKRIFVVETMGRTAGWLALEGGEACGAYIILIPEHDFSFKRVNELVMEGRRQGARYEIIMVAEGAKPGGGEEIVKKEELDPFGNKTLGGIGAVLAAEIQKGTQIETRSVELSHLQRGGAPCAYDRRMGRYFGIAAVDLVVKKKYGQLVCLCNGKIDHKPLEKIYGRISHVDPDTQYDKDRYNGRRTIFNNTTTE